MNVYGFLDRPLGLGEAARSSLRALEAAGVPVAGIALDEEDLWRPRPDLARRPLPPYSVNLCHVNGPEAGFLMRAFGPRAFRGRLNIGYWFWELAELPRSWDVTFRYFDEIWVASSFVEKAVAARSPVPVRRLPLSIDVRLPERDWRAHFGIPAGRAAFLCMYDARSTAARKNPAASVLAVRKAAEGGRKPIVIVKTLSPDGRHAPPRELRDALDGADAIIVDRTLSREETWGLIAACDAFVSLHRGEGFGLVIAEAMALGKPVVATGYSGNTDFMTAENSYAVDFRLVRSEARSDPYQKGCLWAEPDVEHAAALVADIMDHPDAARERGASAARTVNSQFSPRTAGLAMRSRLEELGLCFE